MEYVSYRVFVIVVVVLKILSCLEAYVCRYVLHCVTDTFVTEVFNFRSGTLERFYGVGQLRAVCFFHYSSNNQWWWAASLNLEAFILGFHTDVSCIALVP